MKISKRLSETFLLANLIAMLLVILIHYNSKWAIDISTGYSLNYLVQEFLANGIARSAVPIFAFLSGYFIVDKLEKNSYQELLLNKYNTLFKPYIIGAFLIYSPFLFYYLLFKPEHLTTMGLYAYMYNLFLHPASGQFWFLRDLMLLVVISPLLFKSKKVFAYPFIFVLFFLWLFDIQPFPKVADWYMLNIETLFFFYCGGILRQMNFNIESVIFRKKKIIFLLTFIWFGLIILRIYIDPVLDVWYVKNYTLESVVIYKIGILLGVLNLLQLSGILKKYQNLYYLSGLTFFVYLFHNSPLHRITHLTKNLLNPEYNFYIYFPIIVITMFLFAHIMSVYFPKSYTLVSGNRSPKKALQRIEKDDKLNV